MADVTRVQLQQIKLANADQNKEAIATFLVDENSIILGGHGNQSLGQWLTSNNNALAQAGAILDGRAIATSQNIKDLFNK